MQTQRGIAIRYFATAAITDAVDANGVGKAVIHSGDAEEVAEGTEAGYADFAGVIKSVRGGKTDAELGDEVGVDNDKVVEVKMSGASAYKDLITTDDDGKFQKLTLSATPTAEEILKICGRILGSGTEEDGDTTTALIWVRK
jgi:hypothetical protein